MVIVNSYVSLPEGKPNKNGIAQNMNENIDWYIGQQWIIVG